MSVRNEVDGKMKKMKKEETLTRAGGRKTKRCQATRDRRCRPSIVCRTQSGSAFRSVADNGDITYAGRRDATRRDAVIQDITVNAALTDRPTKSANTN